jgi:Pyridoxamine 5'-phosphate oxidase
MKIIEQSENIDLDEFMKKPLFAHLATIGESGPADSPVWCLWEKGYLWICTDIVHGSFGKRIENDGRCAIGIVDFDHSTGKLHHVGFRGTAEVVSFDIDIGTRIFAKYVGPNQETWPDWFRSFLNSENARLIQFSPKTVVVRDGSYEIIGRDI